VTSATLFFRRGIRGLPVEAACAAVMAPPRPDPIAAPVPARRA
jgi:hypothetical protein